MLPGDPADSVRPHIFMCHLLAIDQPCFIVILLVALRAETVWPSYTLYLHMM